MKHILEGERANISEKSFIAPNAMVLGDVRMGEGSSVWFGSVLRGDINYIQIGKYTNIQDLSVLHVDFDKPCVIGDYVTVGHQAAVHACTIENNVLIGMGAIILNGAKVCSDNIIGAGALVPEGAKLESGYLYVGIPAKPKRALLSEEIRKLKKHAENYWDIASKWAEKIAEEELG